MEEGSRAVGVVGKLYPGKGQKEVLLALARLAGRYPDLKLIIIGTAADRRYEQDLRRLVRLNHLSRRVVFAGFRPDIVEVLQNLSVVVVASVVDSFGRAALEGMAAGVPVLAVKAGGSIEIIRPGRNGFLAESRDPEVLAAALAEILDHPEHWPAIVENGFRTVREDFSIEKQVQGVSRVLLEVCGRTILCPSPPEAGSEGPLFASLPGGGKGDGCG